MTFLCLCLIAIVFVNAFEAKTIFYQSNDIVSPCDDPDIYTADRMMNNTVRIYRGNYYWELSGPPDVKGFLTGPYRIPYRDFRPVGPSTKVVTVLGTGDRVGRVVRLEGRYYDSWRTDPGNWALTISERGHMYDLPKSGVDAIFHNGNKTNPMFIAMDPIKVRYLTTKMWDWPAAVGDANGYIGGQFGENFPSDVTAAFSYRSSEPEVEYYVYLFKKDKFCMRPNKLSDSSKKCEQWYPNKQLFGCNNSESGTGLPENTKPPEEVLTDGKVIEPEDYSTETQAAKESPKNFCSRIDVDFILLFLMIIMKNVINVHF